MIGSSRAYQSGVQRHDLVLLRFPRPVDGWANGELPEDRHEASLMQLIQPTKRSPPVLERRAQISRPLPVDVILPQDAPQLRQLTIHLAFDAIERMSIRGTLHRPRPHVRERGGLSAST